MLTPHLPRAATRAPTTHLHHPRPYAILHIWSPCLLTSGGRVGGCRSQCHDVGTIGAARAATSAGSHRTALTEVTTTVVAIAAGAIATAIAPTVAITTVAAPVVTVAARATTGCYVVAVATAAKAAGASRATTAGAATGSTIAI